MDPWAVLGIPPEATYEDARKVWRLRVQLLHPDRHMGAPDAVRAEATRAMAEINNAWNELRVQFEEARPRPTAPEEQPPRTQSDRSSSTRTGRTATGGANTRADAGQSGGRSTNINRDDALGFILDALDQMASFASIPLSARDRVLLASPMSSATVERSASRLIDDGVKLLVQAIVVDAVGDVMVVIDGDVRLPQSWVESYEAFADQDDPPLAFALLESAARR